MSEIPTSTAVEYDREHKVVPTTIEPLKLRREYSSRLDTLKPIETRGEYARIATFELGSYIEATDEAMNPDDSTAVMLDVWEAGDEMFVLPRSVEIGENPQEIAEKAWNLTDAPGGIAIGRLPVLRAAWQEKFGFDLPESVSRVHFGIEVKDGALRYKHIGTNGSRIETAVLGEEQEGDDITVTAPRPRNLTPEPAMRGAITPSENMPRQGGERKSGGETDAKLQGMRNQAIGWSEVLGSAPTQTDSSQLYGVSASLAADRAALGDVRDVLRPAVGSRLDNALSEVESAARQAEALASMVASYVDSGLYATGAEAHMARRQVEVSLQQYSDNLDQLRGMINRQEAH